MYNAPNRLIIEHNYVSMMGLHLNQFNFTPSIRVATFKCPVCGGHKRNNRKTSGYIFVNQTKRDHYSVKCHNCSYSGNFLYFLKDYFPSVFSQIKMELMVDIMGNKKKREPVFDESVFLSKPVFKKTDTVNISSLDDNHPAKIYCVNRKIPITALDKILYTDNYKKYIAKIDEEKSTKLPEDPRIIFEMKNRKGDIIGVQGRVIEVVDEEGNVTLYHPKKENYTSDRFITIKFDVVAPKIYGLEYVNTLQPIIVTEGIIDSYFMNNSIALAGGDVVRNLHEIIGCPKNNIYIVLDNEPRSADTVRRMEKAIEYGYNVYFWAVNTKYKDINKMVLNGIKADIINDKVLKDSLSGFEAKMKLHTWRKV